MKQQPAYNPDYHERRRQLMNFANSGIVPPGINTRSNGITQQENAFNPTRRTAYNVTGGNDMSQHNHEDQDLPDLPETVSDLFPSKWLSVSDLNGRTFDLVIDRVDRGMFPIHPRTREKELKAIVFFKLLDGRPTTKGLILNSTQATQIAEIAKTERFAQWPGTAVTLIPATAPNGKPTIGIRPGPAPEPKTVAIVTKDPQPEKPDPPAPAGENGLFDMTYRNGDPVLAGHRAMFTNYRRANSEDVPEDFEALQRWVSRTQQ